MCAKFDHLVILCCVEICTRLYLKKIGGIERFSTVVKNGQLRIGQLRYQPCVLLFTLFTVIFPTFGNFVHSKDVQRVAVDSRIFFHSFLEVAVES